MRSSDLEIGTSKFVRHINILARIRYIGVRYIEVRLYRSIVFFISGDVGGTAGLWLGASFLSIIELMYMLGKHFFAKRDTGRQTGHEPDQ